MMGIIDAIDQAISCQRDGCTRPINNSVSDDFCSENCQAVWHAQRSEPLVEAPTFFGTPPVPFPPIGLSAAEVERVLEGPPEQVLMRKVRQGYREFHDHVARSLHSQLVFQQQREIPLEMVQRHPEFVERLKQQLARDLYAHAASQGVMVIAWEGPHIMPSLSGYPWDRSVVLTAVGIPQFTWPAATPGRFW